MWAPFGRFRAFPGVPGELNLRRSLFWCDISAAAPRRAGRGRAARAGRQFVAAADKNMVIKLRRGHFLEPRPRPSCLCLRCVSFGCLASPCLKLDRISHSLDSKGPFCFIYCAHPKLAQNQRHLSSGASRRLRHWAASRIAPARKPTIIDWPGQCQCHASRR